MTSPSPLSTPPTLMRAVVRAWGGRWAGQGWRAGSSQQPRPTTCWAPPSCSSSFCLLLLTLFLVPWPRVAADPVIMTCNRCRRINGPRGREGGNHAPLRLNGLCILCQDSEPCDECGGIGSVQAAVPGRGRTNFCVLCLSEVAEQYPDIRGVYVAGREHRSTMNQERPVGVNMWADDAKEEHEEFWEQEKMPDEHDYLNTCRGCGKFFRYMYFDCDTCSGWDTKRYRICCDCREGGFHTAHHLLVGHTHIYERGQA
eukprot:m.73716 g.73716  ORF g.73716 m.73716 type:complete len:256 (-) comp8039_c0_seq2:213-980(-)